MKKSSTAGSERPAFETWIWHQQAIGAGVSYLSKLLNLGQIVLWLQTLSPSSTQISGVYRNKNSLCLSVHTGQQSDAFQESLKDLGWQRLHFDEHFTSTGERDVVNCLKALDVSLALPSTFHRPKLVPEPHPTFEDVEKCYFPVHRREGDLDHL